MLFLVDLTEMNRLRLLWKTLGDCTPGEKMLTWRRTLQVWKTRTTLRCSAFRLSAMAGCALLSLALMSSGVANALTTITVNSLDGHNPGTTLSTLRDAINAANSGATVNGCTVPAADTSYAIVFESGLTGTITLGSKLPDIESDLSITAPGPIGCSGSASPTSTSLAPRSCAARTMYSICRLPTMPALSGAGMSRWLSCWPPCS